ncbi:PHD finger protein 10 [Mortierella sp. AD031]|nr:PHD finger protein 10 [Mortierella sp. AD031]
MVGNPGRPSRSRKGPGAGSSRTVSAPPEPKEPSDDEELSIDKDDGEEGQDVEGDGEDIEGEIEEAGEAKITKDGELLGGREYKCRNFKLPTRGDRIYMMSMDAARVLGFRDSYLFFLKNPQLVRVNTTVEERAWMIEKGMLMANFKSKLIAVVTARSLFKSFGYRIVKKGRSRVDDYYESRATDDGAADDSEDDTMSKAEEDGSLGPNGTGPISDDTPGQTVGKRKHTLAQQEESTRQVTDLNWLYESAMAVRALNGQLKELRKENPKFLDPHTNIEQIPLATQPERCKVTVAPKQNHQEQDSTSMNIPLPTVLSIPRSIGPQVDAVVKVEIKGATPVPPIIDDPSVWAVIPEDIRRALEGAEVSKPKEEEENEDLTKFPLSLQEGQYQAAFPIHQARFQQPYRVVLPSGMTAHAQYLHSLHIMQSGGRPIMEQATLPGATSEHDIRILQWQQQQQQQQQQHQMQQTQQQHVQQLQQQQQQKAAQQTKLQQQQQEAQASAKKADSPATQSTSVMCGAPLKTGLGYCQRLVSTQGEHCPNHRGTNSSQPGTPVVNGKPAANACGECSLASAPTEVIPADRPLPCALTHLNQCKTCSKSYHPLCLQLDTPRIISAIGSYPWQCNDCKLCVVCMEAGDEASLLICDDCDRGWHMSCCDPAIKEVPNGEWLCSFCAQCHSCRGTEDPSARYKHAVSNPGGSNKYQTYLTTFCSPCHENFSKGRFCPVCVRTYKGDDGEDDQSDVAGEDDNNMVCCDECNRWVHMDCDDQLTEEKVEEMGTDESLKYTCPPCADKVAALRPGTSTASQAAAMASVTPEIAMLSLTGQAPPLAKACGTLGGKIRVRGLVEYKGKMIGAPEIVGAGVEYDRRLVLEIAALKNKAASRRKQQHQRGGGGGGGRGLTKSRSPVRRASIASSTSSSLSSLSGGSVDS